MNIIFLDVDGVLNSIAYFKWLNESGNPLHKNNKYIEISDYHLQMLAKIYHTCNAKIVLSSTWRELDCTDNKSCKEMYKYLTDELARYNMFIFDKTPVIVQNRPLEIKTWLDNRVDKNEIRFVSLDDDFSKDEYDEYGIGEYLVKTEFFCKDISDSGLQQEHVDKAIEILGRW